MGTRHRQSVIDTKGVKRVNQYGQWDGYPEGQGVQILNYLKNGDLNKLAKEVAKLRPITNAEFDSLPDETWMVTHPHLSRDCGSKIYYLIENGNIDVVNFADENNCRDFCEGFYEIDLQNRTFSSEFGGIVKIYSLDNLPTEESYLEDMEV